MSSDSTHIHGFMQYCKYDELNRRLCGRSGFAHGTGDQQLKKIHIFRFTQ